MIVTSSIRALMVGLLTLLLIATSGLALASEPISEKEATAVMRTIGHKLLLSLGDSTSRVLPIEYIEDYYKISFSTNFSIDPGDIAAAVKPAMPAISSSYMVELVTCDSGVVAHSYKVRMPFNPEDLACDGRRLPEDCYSLQITPLVSSDTAAVSAVAAADEEAHLAADEYLRTEAQEEKSPLKPAYLILPVILLLGLGAVAFEKRSGKNATNPNLVAIGSRTQLDKRNMALHFKEEKVELSHKETELLALLHDFANEPLERKLLLEKVWGDEGDYVGRTLDVFISKLRKKLEPDDSVKIVNIRGIGYKLVVN